MSEDRPAHPWSSLESEDVVDVDLSDEERALLWEGLHQWGGPTRPTDLIANAMGFESVDSMHLEAGRICEALKARQPLSKRDWGRALVATEIVFASSYYGAAGDWEIVSGWTDERTVLVLRDLQRTFAGLGAAPRHRRSSDLGH